MSSGDKDSAEECLMEVEFFVSDRAQLQASETFQNVPLPQSCSSAMKKKTKGKKDVLQELQNIPPVCKL